MLIFSFSEEIFYCSSRKIPERAVEIPPSETVIKGPREGFTESLTTNLSLIRRRVANEKLKIEELLLEMIRLLRVPLFILKGLHLQVWLNRLKEES